MSAVAKLGAEKFAELDVKVRVGIATGLVVVGDIVAEGVVDRHGVVGEAANLAARLQAMAEPNTVLVSEFTRQLASETFEYRDLGRHALKGFAQPVPVYQVIGQREVSRLEARGAALTPFVGREQEVALLLDRWALATSRKGQVVALVGQGGVGKSRVAAEAAERIARRSASAPAPVVLQFSPYSFERTALSGGQAPGPESPHRGGRLTRPFPRQARETFPRRSGPPRERSDGGRPAWRRACCGCGTRGRRSGVKAATDDRGIGRLDRQMQQRSGDDPGVRGRAMDRPDLETAAAPTDGLGEDRQCADCHYPEDRPSPRGRRILRDIGLIAPDGGIADHVTIHEIRELDRDEGRALAVVAGEATGRVINASRLNALVDKSGGLCFFSRSWSRRRRVASSFPRAARWRQRPARYRTRSVTP